jgi:hypothetical protein
MAIVPSIAAVGGILVAVVTAWLGIESYNRDLDTRAYAANKDLQQRIFEARKPFYERQTAFYVDAMDAVSRIANSSAPTDADMDAFWQLYWGRLAAVEDSKVDAAMVAFAGLIKAKARPDCLQSASLLLAHCVRQSWSDTWGVELGQPPELPCVRESFDSVRSCK